MYQFVNERGDNLNSRISPKLTWYKGKIQSLMPADKRTVIDACFWPNSWHQSPVTMGLE